MGTAPQRDIFNYQPTIVLLIFFKRMSIRKNRNTTNDITTKVSYVVLLLVVIAKLCAQPEQYSCQAVKGSQAETTKVEIIS